MPKIQPQLYFKMTHPSFLWKDRCESPWTRMNHTCFMNPNRLTKFSREKIRMESLVSWRGGYKQFPPKDILYLLLRACDDEPWNYRSFQTCCPRKTSKLLYWWTRVTLSSNGLTLLPVEGQYVGFFSPSLAWQSDKENLGLPSLHGCLLSGLDCPLLLGCHAEILGGVVSVESQNMFSARNCLKIWTLEWEQYETLGGLSGACLIWPDLRWPTN